MVVRSQDDSEGTCSLIEMIHPPIIGRALHIHPNSTEAYYVLEGKYSIQYGKKSYHSQIRDFVFIPKGISHIYQSGPNGRKVLVISSAGLEKYFHLLQLCLFCENIYQQCPAPKESDKHVQELRIHMHI
jgi:uncharacterized RmlC-like cupin family protein